MRRKIFERGKLEKFNSKQLLILSSLQHKKLVKKKMNDTSNKRGTSIIYPVHLRRVTRVCSYLLKKLIQAKFRIHWPLISHFNISISGILIPGDLKRILEKEQKQLLKRGECLKLKLPE